MVITIAATFVAEPMQSPLQWLLDEAGLTDEIHFAPYNQLFQQLLNPSSDLRRDDTGTNVLLVRIEDFARDMTDPSLIGSTIQRVTMDLANAIHEFADKARNPLILAVLPPGPRLPPELSPLMAQSHGIFLQRIRSTRRIHLIDQKQIDASSADDPYDPVRDELAHIPYSDAHYAAIALEITRCIHAMRVAPAKVLVLDCDNTLWRGIVGEDGIDGIEVSPNFSTLQEFAVQQQAKGVLVCLASKNTEADVLSVLEQRTNMTLRPIHLVAHRINWEAKPKNVRSLATELNLGLDSFVFLDDNPVECAQMRMELPQVITIQTPPEAELLEFTRHLWPFDKLSTTAEDANRTQMYRENAARRAMESSVSDIAQFLAALDLGIDIATPAGEEWSRISQLTQRTNQFNFTTLRRSVDELKTLSFAGAKILRIRVRDRFGDYGLVGVIIAEQHASALRVDTFLLSCRVLGRGVEHAMLRRLGELAEAAGLQAVVLTYLATARNVPARAFAESVAAAFSQLIPGGTEYRIPPAYAVGVVHKPGYDPTEIIEARNNEDKKLVGMPATLVTGRSERYSRFAHLLTSGRAILEQMASRPRRRRPDTDQLAVALNSPLESDLLRLWGDLLEIDGLNVEDNYFDMGGTSLLSVQLFSEIAKRFHVQLGLTAILQAPTVRKLAALIDPAKAQQRRGIICLRPGGTRNLFLVHDGLGETLLYLNFARRLPESVSVYGIEPKRLPGIPLAHARFEDMAAHYVEQIRQIQPEGPYMLGGMCAGGVIAYEMAARLVGSGASVEMLAILDGATPQAAKRTGRATRHRVSRLKEAITQASGCKSSARRWLAIAKAVLRKARRALSYELTSRMGKISVRLRFALLKYLLPREAAWPALIPELTVMQIYNSLESRYRPPTMSDVPILLIRASSGNGTDTPYREIYRDEDFGWRAVASRLELVDVSGGHSSMLQEQEISSLASEIVKRVAFDIGSTPEYSN